MEQFRNQYSPSDWVLFQNNMKKKIVVSKDPVENARIKFIRAHNRIIRVQYGTYYIESVINKKVDFFVKVPMLFYYMEKFDMKKNRKILSEEMISYQLRNNISREKFLLQISN